MIELNVSKKKTKIMIDFPINFAFYLILIFVFTKIICSGEILSQNVEARATCGHLKKLFLKKKDMSTVTKMRVLTSVVTLVLLYDSEC